MLDRLPLIYREVLVAHYMMGLSYEEIARVQETNLHTVRMRAVRARVQLKELLHEEEMEERRLLALAMTAVPLSPATAFTTRVLLEVKAMNVSSPALSSGMSASGIHGATGGGLWSVTGWKVAVVIALALGVPGLYLAAHFMGAGATPTKSALALSLPADILQPATGFNPVVVKFPVTELGKVYHIQVTLTPDAQGDSSHLPGMMQLIGPMRDNVVNSTMGFGGGMYEANNVYLNEIGLWSIVVTPTSNRVAAVRVVVQATQQAQEQDGVKIGGDNSAYDDIKAAIAATLTQYQDWSAGILVPEDHPLLIDLAQHGAGPFSMQLDLSNPTQNHELLIKLLPVTKTLPDILTAQATLTGADGRKVESWNIAESFFGQIYSQTDIDNIPEKYKMSFAVLPPIILNTPGTYTLTVTPTAKGIGYIEITDKARRSRRE